MTVVAVRLLHTDLVVINVGHGPQLFSMRALRKPGACAECMRAMPRGTKAFGDATSCALNRMDRYCAACIAAAFGEAQ